MNKKEKELKEKLKMAFNDGVGLAFSWESGKKEEYDSFEEWYEKIYKHEEV